MKHPMPPEHPSLLPPDETLLARESWKIFQIMAEFVEGFERLARIKPAVSVFGSSRSRPESTEYQCAEQVARQLSDAGFAVVSGGGPGIMEAVNKGAHYGKSPSVGLNIEIDLPHEQGANPYQDIKLNFRHFFSRKVMFVKYASAYVVFPGGLGTLDELMEILTLLQTGKVPQIPVILVNQAFWSGLLDWMQQQLVGDGKIDPADMDWFKVVNEPAEVVNAIFDFYEAEGFAPSSQAQHKLMEL